MRYRIALAISLTLATLAVAEPPHPAPPVEPVQEYARTPPSPAAWLEADFLLWWVSKSPNPQPLVTTGPVTANAGAIGEPGTQVLYGQTPVNFGAFPGLRMTLGFWADETQDWGMEGGGFFLAPRTKSFFAASDGTGNPLLAQPFIFSGVGERAEAVSNPGLISGSISVDSSLRLFSWEVNGLARVYRGDHLDFDVLVGFRDLRLSEQFAIVSNITPLVNGGISFIGLPVAAGARVETLDVFGASNDAFLGQVATRLRWTACQLGAELITKIGVGAMEQKVRIQGNTLVFANSTTTTVTARSAGGLLALPSNIGDHRSAQFVVVPEVAGRVYCDVLESVRLSAGYGFLYVSDVVRPGNQINRTINPSQVPTDTAFGQLTGAANQPLFIANRSTFWAHGVNAGVEFKY
jgi:hypothetical protein